MVAYALALHLQFYSKSYFFKKDRLVIFISLIFIPGDPPELHDHPPGPGGPAAGDGGRQGETGTGGEKEPAHPGERSEPATAQGDRG